MNKKMIVIFFCVFMCSPMLVAMEQYMTHLTDWHINMLATTFEQRIDILKNKFDAAMQNHDTARAQAVFAVMFDECKEAQVSLIPCQIIEAIDALEKVKN